MRNAYEISNKVKLSHNSNLYITKGNVLISNKKSSAQTAHHRLMCLCYIPLRTLFRQWNFSSEVTFVKIQWRILQYQLCPIKIWFEIFTECHMPSNWMYITPGHMPFIISFVLIHNLYKHGSDRPDSMVSWLTPVVIHGRGHQGPVSLRLKMS